jgi:hypothetical protein
VSQCSYQVLPKSLEATLCNQAEIPRSTMTYLILFEKQRQSCAFPGSHQAVRTQLPNWRHNGPSALQVLSTSTKCYLIRADTSSTRTYPSAMDVRTRGRTVPNGLRTTFGMALVSIPFYSMPDGSPRSSFDQCAPYLIHGSPSFPFPP